MIYYDKNPKKSLAEQYGTYFFAIVDVIIMVCNFLEKNNNINENLMWVVLIAAVGVIVLTFIITLFIGIKGIQQAGGKYKGGANITLAIIMLVVNLFILAYCVYALLKENYKNQYIYICFYIYYIRCAQKFKKNNENK